MENQHRRISGYRELSQAEIDLMNDIKATGPQLQALLERVTEHVRQQRQAVHINFDAAKSLDSVGGPSAAQAEWNRLDDAAPERWTHIAGTHLQQGLMALTRAVAQPTFF